MSDEFVETGLTFTEDGASYCPVEKRNHGLLGVAASLFIFAGGAVFLGFAMFNAAPTKPEITEQTVTAAPVVAGLLSQNGPDAKIAEEPAEILPATESAIPVPETVAPAPASTPNPVSIAEALAESRAARAATSPVSFEFRAPSLKSAHTGDQIAAQSNGSPPSLKANMADQRVNTAGLSLPLVTPVRQKMSKRPDPFFDISAITAQRRHAITHSPIALAYQGDVSSTPFEKTVELKRGETFVDALKRAGVSTRDRNVSAYAFGEHVNLRRLRPGQEFTLQLAQPNLTLSQLAVNGDPQVRLLSLEFRDGYEQIVFVQRDGEDGFVGRAVSVPLTTELHAAAGRIEGSLYLSAKAQGAPDEAIAALADAFAYDVDFQREIFGGDEFEMIFEAKYDDRGEMVAGGEILFARLNWRGKSREKEYFRFSNDGERADFYDATGQSAKRLLMKTPIDGARLSSRFGTRRHPILGYAKAHKGVDFAARRGTPIKAAGDGVVERADRYGSFGNYVRIRHANGYKTAYAHLKGFRSGIRKGKRVRQGDIIGYVGTTGRSTGPHLHYEVHHRGVAVNPQKLKIATGKQLKGAELERFKMERDRINMMRQQSEDSAPLFASDTEGEKESL